MPSRLGRDGVLNLMPKKPSDHLAKPRSLIASAVMGLLIFALLSVLFEGLFSWTRLDGALRMRSMGNFHTQFEIKWFSLKDYVHENGGVDVILMGNSMVNTGIDPQILAEDYADQTGIELRIFNFGVEGLTVAPNSTLARLLVDEYHPAAIVFVTEMRDYTAANGVDIAEQLLSDAWLTMRLGGEASFRTRLIDRSTYIQHLLPFRNWNRDDFPDTFLSSAGRFSDTTKAGYEPDLFIDGTPWIQPDPEDPEQQAIFAMLTDYSMDAGRLANLADLLAVTSEGTQVVITELPLHPYYFVYFDDPSAHEKYLEELIPFITGRGGVFLRPFKSALIPDSFRSDHYHLNYKGAVQYSAILADQLARLCLNENVCLEPAERTE
jgi:hypothetical protein